MTTYLPALFPVRSCTRGLLVGPAPFRLGHHWLFHLHRQGFPVFAIDCAIRFDVFQIADAAVAHGLPVEAVLSQIQVQRAFTPYQILDALLAPTQTGARPRPVVYALLAPCKQFFDGDVGTAEAEFLLKKMANAIQTFPHPLLVIETNRYRHSAFAAAYQGLQEAVHTSWLLEPGHDLIPLHKPQKNLRSTYGPDRPRIFAANPAGGRTPQRLQKGIA